MLNSFLCEALLIILGVVQANNFSDMKVLENVHIAGGRMSITTLGIPLVNGAHKGNELTRDDPVEVPVFDSLIMLVLLDVEGVEVVPALLDAELETFKAVKDGALVITVSLAGISVSL